jgi:hypothetical protein
MKKVAEYRVVVYAFMVFAIVVTMATLIHMDWLSLPDVWATSFGVGLALWAEARLEEWRGKAESRARLHDWLRLIRSAAEAASSGIVQMQAQITSGQAPTYKPDELLASLMGPATAPDLLTEPAIIEQHRHAVFELRHLSRRLDLVFELWVAAQTALNPPAFTHLNSVVAAEMPHVLGLASSSSAALAALMTGCDQALRDA